VNDDKIFWWNRHFIKKSSHLWLLVGIVCLVTLGGLWVYQWTHTESFWLVAKFISLQLPHTKVLQISIITNGFLLLAIVLLMTTGYFDIAALNLRRPLPAAIFQNNVINIKNTQNHQLYVCAAKVEPAADSEEQLDQSNLPETPKKPSTLVKENINQSQETQLNQSETFVPASVDHELPPTLSYEELVHNLCRQMISAFPADACLISNFDKRTGVLELIHQCRRSDVTAIEASEDDQYPPDHKLFPLVVAEFPALQISFEKQRPLTVSSDDFETAPQEVELLKRLNYGKMVGIPLINRDEVTVALILFSVQPQAFTSDEVKFAQLLANQANIAMENARLFGLANQQLHSRIDELAGLQRISSELNSTHDLDKILSMVLEDAMRVTQADFGDVYFYNAATENLIAYREQDDWLNAVHSGSGDLVSSHSQTTLSKAGIIGRALRSNKVVVIPDVSKDKDFVDLGKNTRSEVVVPIYYGGEPVGVINLESHQPDFFNNDQLRYLEALANHAAIAIGNARAYQQQKLERYQASQRADQLAYLSEISNAFRTNRPLHDILEDIAYAIVEAVGYDTVIISLVQGNPPMLYHEVGAGIPLAQLKELQQPAQANPLANLQEIMLEEFGLSNSYFIPFERMAVWQNKLNVPLIEKDHLVTRRLQARSVTPSTLLNPRQEIKIWQTGDLLLVPLMDINDNIVGLLTVENPSTGKRPDLASIQTLETFANHAAAAIENARLFELETQRWHLADTMRGVAEAISSQLEFDEILNIVLEALARVVDYDSANVQLLEEDQLVIIGGRGWEDSQKMIGLSFPMTGDNPNRVVIETQEPIIVNDVQKEYPASFAGPLHSGIRSWLGVPLTYGIHVLGLMALDKSRTGFFTREDTEMVLAFANQVAVALQNARLFDEARQQVSQLAALTEVAQSINRALDLNEVLNLVLDAVFELIGPSNGSIWLVDDSNDTVKIANTRNISDFLAELFNESNISIHSEPFASVIQSGEMLIIEGSTEKDEIADYGLPFPDDVTYVPMKTEKGVIGILAIEAAIHKKSMRELVTTLADLAAVAIDSARLLEDTRRRAAEMRQLYNLGVEVSGMLEVRQVMRSVIKNALTLSESHVGTILFWDEETNQYIIEGAATTDEVATRFGLAHADWLESRFSRKNPLALWSDFIKQIIDTNQPIVANLAAQTSTKRETEGKAKNNLGRAERVARRLGAQAILGVPIPVQNRINGAIFVSALTPRNFNDQDVQSLSLVANQASVAVRNAQLVQRLNLLTEELEERVARRTEELAQTLQDLTEERDRVEVLYQIGRELATSFDLDRVLTEALHLLNRAIGISLGSILLLDPDTGQLTYRAALGRTKSLPRGGIQTPYKIGYGLAGKVMEDREPRLVPDLKTDPDWIPNNDEKANRRSAIVVPLTTGDEVVGTLLVFNPEPDYFSEAQLKLVTAASAQIAISISKAELYRLITDQADRLGVMYRQQATEAAKNQAILKGITDGVLVIDSDRNIVLVNPKAAEILNLNAVEVENQPLHQLLGRSGSPAGLELTQLLYDNLLETLPEIGGGARSTQFRIEVGPKVLMVSLAPIILSSEGLPSIVAVLRDISKEAEIERLKNEFISMVSHELRTPMTSVKGYADLLLSQNEKVGTLNPIQHRFVKIIQSNSDRLTDLVNDILEISRIETGRVKLDMASLDIIELIKEVAVSFEAPMLEKSMTFSLNLPDHLPNIYADKARVTQILVNLIGNARQYTPEEGNVTLYAKAAGDFVQIDVEDSGIGIVEEDVDYIFDRFFRSERTAVQVVDGTGLGLAITKSFVEMFGGQIWVQSELDVGTTFSFTIPFDPNYKDDRQVIDQLDSAKGPQILIISDENEFVGLLKPGLEAQGFQITALGQGQMALNLAHQANDALRLIILDVSLKDANSFAWLEQFKNGEATVKIPVLLSAFSVDQNGESLYLQVLDYIASTFDAAQVLECIKAALDKTKPDALQSGLPLSKQRERILIVEKNRETSNRLKEILLGGGYQVQCAFNGQQALDMAIGNTPALILIGAKIPLVNDETVISQFRHTPETKEIPLVVITDEPIETEKDEVVSILGRKNGTTINRFVSVDSIISEIVRIETTLNNY